MSVAWYEFITDFKAYIEASVAEFIAGTYRAVIGDIDADPYPCVCISRDNETGESVHFGGRGSIIVNVDYWINSADESAFTDAYLQLKTVEDVLRATLIAYQDVARVRLGYDAMLSVQNVIGDLGFRRPIHGARMQVKVDWDKRGI